MIPNDDVEKVLAAAEEALKNLTVTQAGKDVTLRARLDLPIEPVKRLLGALDLLAGFAR